MPGQGSPSYLNSYSTFSRMQNIPQMFTPSRRLKILLATVSALFCFYFIPSSRLNINCSEVIKALDLPAGAVLLDPILLKSISQSDCTIPEKIIIALPASQKLDDLNPDALSHYEIYLYESLENVNYVKFYPVDNLHNSIKAFPVLQWRKLSGVLIPVNIRQFLVFSSRSKLLGCRGLDMKREDNKPYIDSRKAVKFLVNFQAILLSLNMYPFLVFGTLLGWYRECGIIPHTYDLDMSVMAEEYNPKLFDILYEKKYGFRLARLFGKPENNFEMTIVPQGEKLWFTIDLFLMYTKGKENWMGGTGNEGTRIHFTYSQYTDFCAADLLGHLFWVTCSPERMIRADYGNEWYSDKPTRNFTWWDTPNKKMAGKWELHELNETVRIFEEPSWG